MKKINILPNFKIRNVQGFECDTFYFGGRNLFFPLKNEDKGYKVFLRNGDDPHRVMDQAFPHMIEEKHYDNPDKDVIPLTGEEFKKMKWLYELFESYELGPEVYDTEILRINSQNYRALLIEDLSKFPNPSQEETNEINKEFDTFLREKGFFKNPWTDVEPSNYFVTPERGILAVDLDWGHFYHQKVNYQKLREFKGFKYSTLNRKEISSNLALGAAGLGFRGRDVVKNIIKPNFEEYSEKHDYDFYIVEKNYELNFPNDAYQETQCDTLYKIFVIEELFKKGYDYVAVMDLFDALITNMDIKLESFIDDENSMFISAGERGWNKEKAKARTNINTGFAIYKNDKNTKEFLKRVKEVNIEWNERTRREVNDQVLYKELLEKEDEWWEHIAFSDPLQQSFWFYNKPNFKNDHQFLYEQHESPFIWEEGDFMIHFAGQPSSPFLVKKFYNYLYK